MRPRILIQLSFLSKQQATRNGAREEFFSAHTFRYSKADFEEKKVTELKDAAHIQFTKKRSVSLLCGFVWEALLRRAPNQHSISTCLHMERDPNKLAHGQKSKIDSCSDTPKNSSGFGNWTRLSRTTPLYMFGSGAQTAQYSSQKQSAAHNAQKQHF